MRKQLKDNLPKNTVNQFLQLEWYPLTMCIFR